jgi:flagellar basal-body rod protein FlgB
MSFLNTTQLVLLERYLDGTSMRQTLVATNVANVDTPGYQTRDADFRGQLQRALSGDDNDALVPFVMPVRGLISRPDGNNVSVDRESLLLAEIQLQYKAAISILRAKFAQLSTAIKEGQP